MRKSFYQGGSLAAYVIVGVLLVLAFAGGLYGLQRYNASKDSATPEVAVNGDNKDQDPEKKDTKGPKTPKPADTPVSDGSDDVPTTSSTNNDTATDENSEHTSLPQTGPADTAVQMIALGSLVYAGTVFVRSRAQ